MPRLPQPGGDNGNWGAILNDFLAQALKPDGAIKDNAVTSSAIAPNAVNDVTIADGSITEVLLATAVQTKLNAVAGTPDWNTITNKPAVIAAGVDATAAKAALALVKSDVGLGNVDNTSDATKNSAAVTLTNKTLTGPKVDAIKDTNGNTALGITPTTSAVNYINVTNAITGDWPVIQPTGSDTHIGMTIQPKGQYGVQVEGLRVSTIYGTGDQAQLPAASFTGAPWWVTGTYNYINLQGVQTGNTPNINATGSDTNIALNLIPKGTGKVQVNGVEVATISGTQTLTNKTLTDPKINTVKDANGNNALAIVSTPSAVNYIDIENSPVSYGPAVQANGPGADIALALKSKGSESINLQTGNNNLVFVALEENSSAVNYVFTKSKTTGNGPELGATGTDTNIDLNLYTKGSGIVKANGVEVATVTNTSRLVCTTADGSTGAEDGANTWAKIATFSTGTNQYADCTLTLSVSGANGAHDTAIVSVYFRSNGTGVDPTVDVQIMAAGSYNTYNILNDSFKVISGAWSTDMELWFKKGGQYGRFKFYEVSKSTAGNGTLSYTSTPAWQSAAPTGAVNNISSNGVTAFGVPVATTTDTQTLENKTLTNPKINDIYDIVNNIRSFAISATSGAVNYLQANANTTGNGAQLLAWGSDTNISIELVPKGTGNVKAGGVEVATISGTQTITNKTLTNPKIASIKDNNGNTALDLGTIASAVNNVYIDNQPTGGGPTIGSTGADTNVDLALTTKGTGLLYLIRGNGHSTVQAGGGYNSGNVNLELNSQGTGVVRANSNPVITSTTGIPAVTGTPSSSNYLRGDGTWATPAGGGGALAPVAAATVGSETYTIASGTVTQIAGTTIDGVSIAIGNRILVKDAPASSGVGSSYSVNPGNGVYVVTANTTNLSLSRAADMSGSVIPAGLSVPVMAGGAMNGGIFLSVSTPTTGAAFTYGSGTIEWTITGTPWPVGAGNTITLTNKTLTSPRIGTDIKDTNGNTILAFNPQTSAVNYIQIWNNSTGAPPDIAAAGPDVNIPVQIFPKGSSPVNLYVSTGNTPTLRAAGPDTNLNLNLVSQGTGKVQANGVEVITLTGTQTLTNKTLTTPAIGTSLLDTNGNTILGMSPVGTAVNYLSIQNNQTANTPGLLAMGSDTNITMSLLPKGTGYVRIYTSTGVTPKLAAEGADTNLDLNLTSKGTGVVKANNNPVITSTTGIPAVTGTPSSSNYLRGDGTWAAPSGATGMLKPARVATTGAETYTISSGTVTQINGTTVDGISIDVGDRIVVTAAPASSGSGTPGTFTTQPANGVYIVTNNTTNLTVVRASDMDTGAGSPVGQTVYIERGATYGQMFWTVRTPDDNSAFTYGTTSVKWISQLGADTLFGNNVDVYANLNLNGASVPSISSTDTLTNKKIDPRVTSITSSATPTINTDSCDLVDITTLATNITSMTTSLSGTPVNGQKLIIRFKDSGTARTIAWGASFTSSGTGTLLATTVAGKEHHVNLMYSSGVSKWVCLATDSVGY